MLMTDSPQTGIADIQAVPADISHVADLEWGRFDPASP